MQGTFLIISKCPLPKINLRGLKKLVKLFKKPPPLGCNYLSSVGVYGYKLIMKEPIDICSYTVEPLTTDSPYYGKLHNADKGP